jgi:hypothetical protein
MPRAACGVQHSVPKHRIEEVNCRVIELPLDVAPLNLTSNTRVVVCRSASAASAAAASA